MNTFIKTIALLIASILSAGAFTLGAERLIADISQFPNSDSQLGFVLITFPVATVLIFIAGCILTFARGSFRLIAAIPIGLLIIAAVALYSNYTQVGG